MLRGDSLPSLLLISCGVHLRVSKEFSTSDTPCACLAAESDDFQ